MAEVVVATLNVSFQDETDGASGVLKLEIDDREDGLNGGDTSFKPGDTPGFFLFKDDNVTLVVLPKASASNPVPQGLGTKDVDENVTFSNSDTASLGYPPQGGVTMEWLGQSFSLTGTAVSSNATLPDVNGSELRIPGGKNVIGILHCTYTTQGSLFTLPNVPLDIPEVVIFAVGTVV